MRQGFLMTGAATPDLRVGDPRYNTQKILDLIHIADRHRAKLLVFPELCLTGATCGVLFTQQSLLEAADTAVYDVVAATEERDLVVVFGAPVSVGGCLYNCAIVASHGKVFGVVPQTVVTDTHFTPAPRYNGKAIVAGMEVDFGTDLIFENLLIPELRFAVTVGCEALSPYSPAARHCSAGANLLLCLTAKGIPAGGANADRAAWEELSARLGCGIVRADAGEGESTQGLAHMGHNMILENGELLRAARLDSQAVTPCELDLQLLERVRTCGQRSKHAHSYETIYFDLKPAVTQLLRTVSPFPFVLPENQNRDAWVEDIMELQARFLARRVDEQELGALVVPVDGDVCAAFALLVSIRAAKKLGWENDSVVAVICPHRGMTQPTINRALGLADHLNVVKCYLDINETLDARLDMLGVDAEETPDLVTSVRRRIQTGVAADVAQQVNGLLVLTEDMTDWAMGAVNTSLPVGSCGVNAGLPKTVLRYALIAETARLADQRQLSLVLTATLSQGAGGNNRHNVEDSEHAVFTPLQMNDFFLYHILAHGFGPAKLQRLAEAAFGNQLDDHHIYDCLKQFIEAFVAGRAARESLPVCPQLVAYGLREGQFSLAADADLSLWLRELEAVKPQGYDHEALEQQDAELAERRKELRKKTGNATPKDFDNMEEYRAEMARARARAEAEINRERALEAARGEGLPQPREPLPFIGSTNSAPMPKFDKPSSPEEYIQQMRELEKLAQAQIQREREAEQNT